MSQKRRQRLLVDLKLQGNILVHTALYWLYCLLGIAFVAASWILCVQHPNTSGELLSMLWTTLGPAILGSLVLLPLVLLDSLRLSHRIAGPMIRFRKAMKSMAADEPTKPVLLRDDDFWSDFADDINQIIEKHNRAVGKPACDESIVPPADALPDSVSTGSEETNKAKLATDIYSEISV
jgi:hypothetical protein